VGLRKRDVYPQYYRAKRRRERIAIGASIVVAVVIVTALLALAIAYFIRPREGLDELAQRRDEIVAPTVEEEQAAAAPTAEPQPVEEAPLIALEDITEWAPSVPEVSLIPEGLGTGEPPPEEPPLPQLTEEVVPAEEEPEPEEEEETPAEEESQAQQPEEEPTPARPSEPETRPSPPKPSEPQYTFTVLAGVYDNESEANRQRDRLLELGFQASVLSRSYGDKKSYPVQVDPPLDEFELADAVKKRLRDAGFSDAAVLRRDTGSR
jgi:cell division protein FtsN